MPIYMYEHPETREVFEILRPMSESQKKYKAPDGVMCDRIFHNPEFDKSKGSRRTSRAGQTLEVFQADPSHVKKMKPKFVKFRDGHREKYDPTKHC
jgi:hypothetical protein